MRCSGPPYVVVTGPRRPPTPDWGVLDQPDAGQHRLNIRCFVESPSTGLFALLFSFLHPPLPSLSLSFCPPLPLSFSFSSPRLVPPAPFVLPLDRSLTSRAFVSVRSPPVRALPVLLPSARPLCSRCGSICRRGTRTSNDSHATCQDYVEIRAQRYYKLCD